MSSLLLIITSIVGTASVVYAMCSVALTTLRARRNRILIKDIIESIETIREDINLGEENELVINEQLCDMIATMLSDKYSRPLWHNQKNKDSELVRNLRLKRNGYHSIDLLREKTQQVLSEAEKIDSGQQLKSA